MEEVTQGVPDTLEDVLRRLRRIEGIEAVAVARNDGLVVSHQLPNWVDANKMAAMAAALIGAGSRVAEELRRGNLRQCWLHCSEGRIVAFRTPESTILIALLSEQANMGLVLTALETAAEAIGQALRAILEVVV